MNSDDKTPSENPFAKVVQRLMREELRAFEERMRQGNAASEDRVAALVVARLMPTFNDLRLAIQTLEAKYIELERRISNAEEIQRCSRADTEPPPAMGEVE